MEEKVEMLEEQRNGPKASTAQPLFWRRTPPSLSDGIVVVTAWLFSKPQHLEHYSRFYASCNWDSLISHPKLFNLCLVSESDALILKMPWLPRSVEGFLCEELEKRTKPVVFATFSGGYMACLWKIYQILQGTCDGVDCTLEKYKAVRNCVAGQIHDSSPSDFVFEVGAKFLSSPSVLKTEKRIPIVFWAANASGKVLDLFFHKRFRAQNIAMWTALHKSGDWGPILVLGSKDDDIVSFDVIQEFCARMTGLGCNVTLVAWDQSAHVDHFRRHEEEYKNAVGTFLVGIKESHAHDLGSQSGNSSSTAHVELFRTNGCITTQRAPSVWFREFKPRLGATPANGSLVFTTSRL